MLLPAQVGNVSHVGIAAPAPTFGRRSVGMSSGPASAPVPACRAAAKAPPPPPCRCRCCCSPRLLQPLAAVALLLKKAQLYSAGE